MQWRVEWKIQFTLRCNGGGFRCYNVKLIEITLARPRQTDKLVMFITTTRLGANPRPCNFSFLSFFHDSVVMPDFRLIVIKPVTPIKFYVVGIFHG